MTDCEICGEREAVEEVDGRRLCGPHANGERFVLAVEEFADYLTGDR